MSRNNMFPEQVPLRTAPYIQQVLEENQNILPVEILDYKLLLNNPQTTIEIGQDSNGYFLRVIEVYRIVK